MPEPAPHIGIPSAAQHHDGDQTTWPAADPDGAARIIATLAHQAEGKQTPNSPE